MKKRISRRQALATGAVSTGAFFGSSTVSQAREVPKTWGQDFLTPWTPPENVKRDLTPGPTPIRLSCNAHTLNYEKGMNIPERVKSIRDAGYTACEASDSWTQASDSDIRELNAVLKELDVWFYTIHR
ncbi:hypothetical protein ES708_24807 [subsurface metagenome]